MTRTDWSRYRKCPVCYAFIGEPCVKMSGSAMGLGLAQPTPHSRRKLRVKRRKAV